MRTRHQHGGLKIVEGRWIATWWEDGHRRSKTLGTIGRSDSPFVKLTKSEALNKLAAIVGPINARTRTPSHKVAFGDFVNQVYLPFYCRKWKRSTAASNQDRMKRHLTSEFAARPLVSFTRNELQTFLDQKTALGLSYFTVDHLRWDLKQIFDMAVAEDFVQKNPAQLLFTPRNAKRYPKPVMTDEDVRLLFSVLEVRELLICMLAIFAGMRPGEIFGLMWRHIQDDYIDIVQRLYRGHIDSPKTNQSVRSVALSEGLRRAVAEWREFSGAVDPDSWVFPSERGNTPLAKDNCWRRWIAPRLEAVGLDWVNFQVMRRTSASRMHELNVDPKTVADQLGHSVDVNLNVYSRTALGVRKQAVNALESAIRIV